MDKRTKILLIVLAALVLAGGGYYGYLFMTAEKPVPVPTPAAAPKHAAPAPGVPPAASPVPAKPAAPPAPGKPAAPASTPKPGVTAVPPATVPAPGKPAGSPVPGKPAAPAATPKPGVAATTPAGAPVLAPAQQEAMPESKAYVYSPLGKRDPFMSPLEVPKQYPKVPANARPLERVPTESIQVKAIMWNEKGYRALVISPDNRGYTVKVGDHIGNKGGRIVRITEKRLYVTEKITDILGDVETRNIVLKLHKEAE